MYNNWRHDQRTQQVNNPSQTSISQIDKNMQSILKDKHSSNYDKEKMHTQKLATYVDNRDINTTPMRPDNSIHESSYILDSVSKIYHKKSKFFT